MSSKIQQAAQPGWFTLDAEQPRLLGSRCSGCGTYYFPKELHYCRNPQCESEQLKELPLSAEGTIWSYTNAMYPPPPPFVAEEPYTPFALAAVKLQREGLIVLGQLTRGMSVEELSIGTKVILVLETLYSDKQHDYLVWKWRPQ